MRILSLLLLAGSITGAVQAQNMAEKDVPVIARNALKKRHPSVQNLEWERAAPYYEAVFTLAGNHRAIKFDTKGHVAETEVGMPVANLPAAIKTYMKAHYPKEKIQAAETVTKASGERSYEIRITGMEIVFDAAGTFREEEKD